MDTSSSSNDSWDIMPVKKDNHIDCDRCQMIYWNLLLKLDKGCQTEPATFVSLLAGTKRCDKFHNLQKVRKAYSDTMNEWRSGSYQRVVQNLEIEENDSRAAYRTLQDYDQWTTKELLGALNWSNKLWYRVFHKAERTFATPG
jgi:hypothetical protein